MQGKTKVNGTKNVILITLLSLGLIFLITNSMILELCLIVIENDGPVTSESTYAPSHMLSTHPLEPMVGYGVTGPGAAYTLGSPGRTPKTVQGLAS
jgi:hypothetical protein